MLNEIYNLSNIFSKYNINTFSWHPVIRNVPVNKVPMFRISISANGKVEASDIDKETRETYKYLYFDVHNQFPTFKLKDFVVKSMTPIIDEKQVILKLTDIRKEAIKKFINKFEKIQQEIFVGMEENNKTKSFFELFRRYDIIEDKANFLVDILNAIFNLESSVKFRNKLFKGFYIVFEINDYFEMEINPVNHDLTYKELNEYLQEKNNSEIEEEQRSDKKDIFNNPYKEEDKKKKIFHSVPWMKSQILPYSRNKDSDCFKTYDVNGSQSCPLSELSKKQISDFLLYILKSDYRNKYWCSYRSGKDNLLFIIFVSSSLKTQSNYLEDFITEMYIEQGADKKEIDMYKIEKELQIKSKKFVSNLKGEGFSQIDDTPTIIGIRFPQNGPSNLIYSKIVDPSIIVTMAEEWVNGWENYNTTNNGIKLSKDKFQKFKTRITLNNCFRLINKKWNKSGVIKKEGKNPLISLKIEEMYDAFFSSNKKLNKCVDILASNHIYLMIDMVKRIHNAKKYEIKQGRWDIFSMPVLFSTILYKLEVKKEDYENSQSYLLGKLFSHIDRLHKESFSYGKKVKSVPSELIGTKNINLLLQRPILAVNNVLKKSIHILGKAKTTREKEYSINGSSSSYYDFYQITSLSEKIVLNDIPIKWNSIDRILIALGYFLNK